MAQLTWTKTDTGYTATGSYGRTYSISRQGKLFMAEGPGGGQLSPAPTLLRVAKNQAQCEEDARCLADDARAREQGKSVGSGLVAKLKSNEQAQVLNPTYDDAPHIIVEARAGTGKTTTLIEGLRFVMGGSSTMTPSPQQDVVWQEMAKSAGKAKTVGFCAFNKSIADELKTRVPRGVDAMTMHSLGFRAMLRQYGDLKVESYRVSNIISELLEMDVRALRKQSPVVLTATEKLVGLCKVNLVPIEPDEGDYEQLGYNREILDGLAGHYGIDTEDDRTGRSYKTQVYDLVPKVLHRCRQVDKDRQLDFNDMIWLPVMLDVPLPQYDLFLVDECVPGWTPVMMGDGSSKTIKDIVAGDEVRSFDTARGRAKNCVVTATQKLANRKPLVKIKVKHNHKTAGNRKTNFVVCTTDHKVWTVNRGWVQAGDVQIGDTVIVETAAKTTQKGKTTKAGRDNLSKIHVGNDKGTGRSYTSAEQFNSIKGGNGRGLTVPQQILLDSLGDGWEPEYSVTTGLRPSGYPTHYKIDLANPFYKVAIEIDGNSHAGAEEIDIKKDEFLRSVGWTVFRVTNRQVARDLPAVLQEVCPDGERCPMPATVESVEPTYITEHFVYDITVEDCHNFYANGILVHNCQDLNRCQQTLARRAGRRLVFCGDQRQAIYGFAGADSQSLPNLAEELSKTKRGCVRLPLTVTRRCGKSIVREAQKIVPDFEAFPTNGEGLITRACFKPDGYGSPVYTTLCRDGDMVLCRVNAPLVSQCFRFLREGRKANIVGRDVAAGLKSLITKMMTEEVPELLVRLERWQENETRTELAKKNPSESKLIALEDRVQCVRAFCEGRHTVAEVLAEIDRVFTDANMPEGIRLSSIHRAKGLESQRVFLLMPEGAQCPHPSAKSDWQREQEMNLLYVAITRSITELVFVS